MRRSPTEHQFDGRFERRAEALGAGRPGYPVALYDRILDANGGRRFGVALDIGCGAGHSLDGLFAIAREVRAVEPGDRLRALAQARHPGAAVESGTGEATGLADQCVDLVTIGTAFTWMDADATLREARRVLTPAGLLVIYAYGFPRLSGSGDEVLQRHLAQHWDAHRSERLKQAVDVGERIEHSRCFARVESLLIPNLVEYSIEALMRFLESTSFVSAYLDTLPEPERYLEELEDEFRRESGGQVELDLSIKAQIAHSAREE